MKVKITLWQSKNFFGFTLILFALCSCHGSQVQNPPAEIDKERQAKIEEALKALKDEKASVRGDAAVALGNLSAKEYTKDITELLKDNDKCVRAEAEGVLKEWGVDVEKLKAEK